MCVFACMCVRVTMRACESQERTPDTLESESWVVNHHVDAGDSNPKSPVRAASTCITVQESLHPPFPSHSFIEKKVYNTHPCILFLSLNHEEVHPHHPSAFYSFLWPKGLICLGVSFVHWHFDSFLVVEWHCCLYLCSYMRNLCFHFFGICTPEWNC